MQRLFRSGPEPLRAMRRQLAELDLDWELPPYAPAPKRKTVPFEVIVDAPKTSPAESAVKASSQ